MPTDSTHTSDRPGVGPSSAAPLAPTNAEPHSDVTSRPPTPTPSRAATTPAAPPAGRLGSLSRAAWFALVVGLVVLVLLLVFIVQNNTSARFTFWSGSFTAPLGVAMLFAAIAGAFIGVMVGTVRIIVLGRTVRRLRHQGDTNR